MKTGPEFFTGRLPGGVGVAIHPTKKTKSVVVAAHLVGDLDATATRKALIPMVLRRGTRSHPDLLAIQRHLENLYGSSVASYVEKVGEWQVVAFRLEVTNERFIPGARGILRDGLAFFRELLWEPLTVDGAFREEYLEGEKTNLRLAIESLLDNKAAYAAQRLVEEMCRGEPYALYEHGRVEDIPGIDARSLRAHHEEWIRTYPLELHVAGDVEVGAIFDLLSEVFSPAKTPRSGGHRVRGLPDPVPAGAVRRFVEKRDVHQARLCLGFRHGIRYADPMYEALLVMNGVLGAPGFPQSKLFQNVREKASLAYSVSSSVERTKGLLFIRGGVAPENLSRAEEIILEQVAAIERGDVTESELEAARAMILNSNEMLEDDPDGLIWVHFTWTLNGRPFDLEGFRDRVRKVDAGAVAEVARCLKHDATYVLAP